MFNKKLLLKINTLTLGSVFLLILVGSVVRSMGAGMGCPDWPKCFGEYIPPTSATDLPDNYLAIFQAERIEKNKRLSKTLAGLGYHELAQKITNDPTVLEEEPFDATKAWIEYINRLLGVLIGLFIFLNLVFSVPLWKEDRSIPVMAFAVLILTGFQGWIGSLVVSTNLLHGFITLHMVIALIILALLIWMNVRMKRKEKIGSNSLFWTSLFTLILFIPQLLLGTEVRGIIDDLIASNEGRSLWINYLSDGYFYFHRSYSWLLLAGALMIFYLVKKGSVKEELTSAAMLLTFVVLGMFAGLGMVRFEFPFWLQPLHLILATGIFGLLFYLTLRFKISK